MTTTNFFRWSLGIFLVLGIFYVFPPGGPQPADLFMAVIVMSALFGGLLRIEKIEVWLLLFVAYAFVVSSAWAVILTNPSLYLSAIFFLYNALVYLIFQKYFSRYALGDYSLLLFIMTALFLEVSYMLLFETISIRATGTFTNPNQMSYFGLCFTSLGLMVANHEKRVLAGVVILLMGWVVVLFGLSKAAMIAMAYQTIVFGLLLKKRRGLFLALVAIAAFGVYFYVEDQIISALARIEMIGEDSDDSLAGRGYDRIINDFQYVILGAGDGEYRRHDSVWRGEIHSSLATIFFCYGIPGSFLFFGFLFSVFRRNRSGFVIYIAPLLLYSVTHNGLRFTPFWICLAACSQLGFQPRQWRDLGLSSLPGRLSPR